MEISNENIIFIYLKTKSEIIQIDLKMKQVKLFVEERNKQLKLQLKDKNNNDPEIVMMKLVAKLSGREITEEEIIKFSNEKMEEFETTMLQEYDFNMKIRLDIINDLQVAFDVLKEEMPDLVEKYSDKIMEKTLRNRISKERE